MSKTTKSKKVSPKVEVQVATPKKRGRPRKVRTPEEIAKEQQKKEHKLTLAEKQAIKLQAQRAKEAAKVARGEVEPKNKDRFYCTNKELYAELVNWRDSNKEEEAKVLAAGGEIDYTRRTISEKLGTMILAIGDKILNHSNFRNYPKELKEDMRGQYVLKLIKGLKNFNFDFNNAFAYCSQCAFNSYLIVIGKHYKNVNVKKDLIMKLAMELESYHGINSSSSLTKCIKSYIDENDNWN